MPELICETCKKPDDGTLLVTKGLGDIIFYRCIDCCGGVYNPLENVLKERQKIHGNYEDNCHIGMELIAMAMNALHKNENFLKLPPTSMRENIQFTIIMDLFKTARIVTGNPIHYDHYLDKAGYNTLMLKTLEHLKEEQDGEATKHM